MSIEKPPLDDLDIDWYVNEGLHISNDLMRDQVVSLVQ